MPTISSDTLFHFTDRIEHLVDILTDEFRPHYSLEDFSYAVTQSVIPSVAIPLISFCDIPLSQTAKHMETYGNYGIGLSKSWGIHNGITPVLYSYPTSTAAMALAALMESDLVKSSARQADSATQGMSRSVDHLGTLVGLLKPYEGPFVRRGRIIPRVRFYGEREWRYIPSGFSTIPTLARDAYLDFAALRRGNDDLRSLPRLSFGPPDIKYIVVSTEAEILPVIREVERIKAKYTPDQVKVLTSRIISAQQIIEDF